MRKSPAEKIVWMKLNIEPGTLGRLVPAEQPPEGPPLGSSVWAWLWTRRAAGPRILTGKDPDTIEHISQQSVEVITTVWQWLIVTHCSSSLGLNLEAELMLWTMGASGSLDH